ncbi:protein MpRLK-Pelle_L-LEC7 [Marchantia polymorpha subsp. ruderalis]|uniref:non-specific serine/threonine protein kinase n=2 Tax=Marchantia polymorpha TaxID=3197 RepID=A0AAF6B1K1_MARPO|nr:hypothetical protein MARPO_0004s0002 [Marchantia polymorpha]BBN05885.1 hypothetical protein Mp_3g16690 [Marchantia polymorpha subsp. ruderalis]|eukprot:PTQ48691.1 hypothetical protein MARPO_0004s0002 [Marchantia polymorpha]
MGREGVGLLFALWIASGATQFVVHAVTSSFSVQEGSFSCGSTGNMLCSRDASTTAEGVLLLTPREPYKQINSNIFEATVGMALYKEPIQLLNTTSSHSASFNISFSISMNAVTTIPGDGMAFVMCSQSDFVGAPGRTLGAFSKNQLEMGINVLAVEFDTYQNNLDSDFEADADNNHVGIDINSINSKKADYVWSFRLVESGRLYAWVDYDSTTSTLEMRISQTSEKPAKPKLSYSTDLRTVFHKEQVWVGFSAANGNSTSYSYSAAYDLTVKSSFPIEAEGMHDDNIDAMQWVYSSEGSKLYEKAIAGVSVGVAAAVLGAYVVSRSYWLRKRRNMSYNSSKRGGGSDAVDRDLESIITGLSFTATDTRIQVFKYKDLSAATNNFDDDLKLGTGGFGSVYRGRIPGTDRDVAVKRMDNTSPQGSRQFLAEVYTVSQLRHRNIVQLRGWCSDGPESSKYLLVYELMPKGSLDNYLYSQVSDVVLSWEGRFKILEGLAAALHYMHEGWRHQVIHRDVKTSNIMLDDDFQAVLGDFGLARASRHSKDPPTTSVAGTHGYIAPEALLTGKYTVKTDVFAYGAVALEIVCGRKIYDLGCPTDEIVLLDWVWEKLSEDKLLSVVDPRLVDTCDMDEVEGILLLGLLCSHPVADDRPVMSEVLGILAGTVVLPPIPKSKPVFDSNVELHRSPHVNGAVAQVGIPTGSEPWCTQLFKSGKSIRDARAKLQRM